MLHRAPVLFPKKSELLTFSHASESPGGLIKQTAGPVPRDPSSAGVGRAREPACLASSQVTLMLPAFKPPWVALMKGIHPCYCHHHLLTDEELGSTEARHRKEDKQPPGYQCSRDATPAASSLLLWGNPHPFLRHSWELQILSKKAHKSAHVPSFCPIISRGIKMENFQKAYLFSWPTLGGPVLPEAMQSRVRVCYTGTPKSRL